MPTLAPLPAASCVELCPGCGHPYIARRPGKRGRSLKACSKDCAELIKAVAVLEAIAPRVLQGATLARLMEHRGCVMGAVSQNRAVPPKVGRAELLQAERKAISLEREALALSLQVSIPASSES